MSLFFGVIFSDAIQKGCGFVLSCVVSAVTELLSSHNVKLHKVVFSDKNIVGGLNDFSEAKKILKSILHFFGFLTDTCNHV